MNDVDDDAGDQDKSGKAKGEELKSKGERQKAKAKAQVQYSDALMQPVATSASPSVGIPSELVEGGVSERDGGCKKRRTQGERQSSHSIQSQ